mmetsp:Transcript_38384/g.124431  ORF Transcript_38384/g.124431 Transcript_38384/m.124431 type:complete len:240 (-) Transcript_38384:368-1087(-)
MQFFFQHCSLATCNMPGFRRDAPGETPSRSCWPRWGKTWMGKTWIHCCSRLPTCELRAQPQSCASSKSSPTAGMSTGRSTSGKAATICSSARRGTPSCHDSSSSECSPCSIGRSCCINCHATSRSGSTAGRATSATARRHVCSWWITRRCQRKTVACTSRRAGTRAERERSPKRRGSEKRARAERSGKAGRAPKAAAYSAATSESACVGASGRRAKSDSSVSGRATRAWPHSARWPARR